MSLISQGQVECARVAFSKSRDLRPVELQQYLKLGRRPVDRILAVLLERGEIVADRRTSFGQVGAPPVVYRRKGSEASS